MPFTLRFDAQVQLVIERGRLDPVVVCDGCGELITDARQAVAINNSEDARGQRDVALLVAHAGECKLKVERSVQKDTGFKPGSFPLSNYLRDLMVNSGLLTEADAKDLGRR